MSSAFNLKTFIQSRHVQTIRDLMLVIEQSDLPYIDQFTVHSDPYDDYPEFDPSLIQAILLFPTLPDMDGVKRFLEEGVLVLPISYIGFIPDAHRGKFRWGQHKVTYQALVKMFFSLTESTVNAILRINPGVFLIGMDEFGRVLISKYIKHTKEFILNHSKVARSFDTKHLDLVLETLQLHKPVKVSKSASETEEREPAFEVPKKHLDYYMDL